jgi:hypothetical protein
MSRFILNILYESASYPMCTGGFFPGCEADHSPSSSAEIKNKSKVKVKLKFSVRFK